MAIRLQFALLLIAPFFFVALFHHMRFSVSSISTQERRKADATTSARQKISLSRAAKMAMLGTSMRGLHTAALTAGLTDTAAEAGDQTLIEGDATALAAATIPIKPRATAERQQATGVPLDAPESAISSTAATGHDVAADYPSPTLSEKRLLDTSENWLPVPDAEAAAPSDLAWRTRIPASCKPPPDATAALAESASKTPKLGPSLPQDCVCPVGRRPYHTILTAQASTYQRWQTLIFYHHFRKAQRLNPCTEMTGFTRLLASANGGPDDLMEYMPTVTVSQLGFDKTRGFQVINRPWTMLKFLEMKVCTRAKAASLFGGRHAQ